MSSPFKMNPGRGPMQKTGRGIPQTFQSPLEQGGFMDYLKKGANTAMKIGRTALRTAGDVAVQASDFFTPDPGNVGRSSDGFSMGSSRSQLRSSDKAKDNENKHYNKTRQMVKEGKIYDMGTADLFDDSGYRPGSHGEANNTQGFGGKLSNGKRNPTYKGGNK